MLILPWYIRMCIDTLIITTPFLYLHYHPTTFPFEYLRNRRRIKRRKSLQQVQILQSTTTYSPQQVKNIYKELKMEL